MIGRMLSHYRIVERLGEGGMGEVFLAEDVNLLRKVAVKVLLPQYAADASRRKRFIREAIAASTLTHPNVATIFEADDEEGTAFIVMEYVAGETVKEILERRALSFAEIIEVATQIAEALDQARHLGIVHRDLKPANIMVDARGCAKVLDFGVAKVEGPVVNDAPTVPLRTDDRAIVGTIAYMSPEQAQGRPVDHRSDIFSFGALLYEMVCRARAFPGGSVADTVTRVMRDQPERLSRLRADCPPELERIVARAMQKDPGERYQSARELLLDLQAFRSHDRQSAPRSSERRLLWGGVAVVLVIGVVLALAVLRRTPPASAPAPSVNTPRSVAVLAFVSMSTAPGDEFFADGVSEEIINALAQLRELKVVSRTSSFAFKGRNADVRKIGEELNVDSVVEGSVRRSGNKLRITAQLVNVRDGFHLWSDTYQREMNDIFAVQDEIAEAVARRLQATAVAPVVRPPTRNLEAYELYLKGRHFSGFWTTPSLEKGIAYYRQALEKDPRSALIYAGLADAYSLLDHTPTPPPGTGLESYALATAAARRALEIDPNAAEAHAALGHILTHQGDFAAADGHFRRARALNPNSATALTWHSVLLRVTLRGDESANASAKARELDPLGYQTHSVAAATLHLQGRLDDAIQAAQRARELAPESAGSYLLLAHIHALKGNQREAERLLEEAGRLPTPPVTLDDSRAFVSALAGRNEEALSILESQRRQNRPVARAAIFAYAVLGRNDEAIALLKRYAAERPNYARLTIDWPAVPVFDAMRADTRYQALREQMGLPADVTLRTR